MRQVAIHMNAIATLLPEGFHVGINFSASHIVASTFVEECLHYKRSFTQQDLNLVVEVTEREPLDIDEHLVNTLNELHNNGFAIALDDFGTGYSGLSYLQDLHIDYIKIDQSFVARVNANEDSTLILDSVLELAKKLSISIVAEGVETEEQLDYLTRNHIRFLQGFSFTNLFLSRNWSKFSCRSQKLRSGWNNVYSVVSEKIKRGTSSPKMQTIIALTTVIFCYALTGWSN
jgi:EAL domain-containing protein (putative c-di-GMP-specific phosphodiesterase class I)